jgi:hypothetical protein
VVLAWGEDMQDRGDALALQAVHSWVEGWSTKMTEPSDVG